MSGLKDPRPSAMAVTLLATTVVLLGGLVATTATVISLSSNPLRDLLIVTLAAAGIAVFLTRIGPRAGLEGERAPWWHVIPWLRPKRRVRQYRLRLKAAPAAESSPQPPTAEQIRELSSLPNTWVPSSGSRRPPPAEPEG